MDRKTTDNIWTTCKDRLPEDDKDVLVLCPGYWGGNEDPLHHRFSFKVFQGKFRCTEGWSILNMERRTAVFAWMNVPGFPENWIEEIKNHG